MRYKRHACPDGRLWLDARLRRPEEIDNGLQVLKFIFREQTTLLSDDFLGLAG